MKVRSSIAMASALLAAAQPVLAQADLADGQVAALAIDEPVEPVTPAPAEEAPQDSLPPLYQPQDKLERGLWMQMDEYERDLKVSPLIIRDQAINDYVRGVLCRVTGEAECRNIRLYIIRTPYFNASMAPNGVMQVWSGLMLRTQNEAQLASVLAHEYTHFSNRHSVKLFRDAKSKSNAAAWLAFTGIGLIASIGLASALFKFSREMEKEADIGGVALMAQGGYDTSEAAVIWEQLRAEMDATAEARGRKSRKDKNGGLFATHPPSAERVAYLKEEAIAHPGVPGANGLAEYRAAMSQYWPIFVDDQLKMNDFGASEYLLASIASGSGWTSWLNYARGELYRRRGAEGDFQMADEFYSDAIMRGGDLPELWRGRGLVRLKLCKAVAGKADLAEYLQRAPEASDRAMIELMSRGEL